MPASWGTKLIGNVGIAIDDKHTITEEILEEDRRRWGGKTFVLTARLGPESDIGLLRIILFEMMPFIITGDEQCGPLIYITRLARFPYSINGKREFSAYGIQLIPINGKLAKLEIRSNCGLAINGIEVLPSFLRCDLANSGLRAEIYFDKQTPEQIAEIPKISPPKGFRENHFV